jgi:hypothetical protein
MISFNNMVLLLLLLLPGMKRLAGGGGGGSMGGWSEQKKKVKATASCQKISFRRVNDASSSFACSLSLYLEWDFQSKNVLNRSWFCQQLKFVE